MALPRRVGRRWPSRFRGKVVALAAGVLLWAAAAGAETVRVRSGEHDTYTRLVFMFAEPTGWVFGRAGAAYELRLERDGIDLDVSQVFGRVPRSRLADLRVPEAGRLRLDVTPGHRAVPFDLRPGVLVIDVRDGAPAADSPFEVPLDDRLATGAVDPAGATLPRPRSRRTALSDALTGSGRTVPPGPEDFWLDRIARAAPEPSVSAGTGMVLLARPADRRVAAAPQPPDTPSQPDPGDVSDLPDLAEARDDLLRHLSRAVAQGLVEPAGPEILEPGRRPDRAGRPDAQPGATSAPQDTAHEADAAVPPAASNIRAETSIDRAGHARTPQAMAPDADLCPDEGALDIASWADEGPPAGQIAARRRALMGEFDRPSAESVAGLARVYLHFGFGAEAAATLAALPVAVEDADLLLALAAIVDGDPPSPAARLRSMTGCDGAVALWALLARDAGDPGDALDAAAVRRGFAALPLQLQRHLAPDLVERFLAIGDHDAAMAVRNAAVRATGDPGSGLALIGARLAQAAGDGAAADAVLREIVATGGPDRLRAAVMLVQGHLDRGEPVPRPLVDTAAALAFEHRGATAGRVLARAEILGHASAGSFDEAFAALRRLRGLGTAGDDPAPAIIGPLFSLLVDGGSDEDFLRMVFAATASGLSKGIGAPAIEAVAARLLDLGFAEAARDIVAAPAQPADRLLMVQAALVERDGRAALRALAGRGGPDAALLRGRALSLIGDHAAAAAAFAEAGAGEDRAAAAFRGGLWDLYLDIGPAAEAALLRRLGVAGPDRAEATPAADDPGGSGAIGPDLAAEDIGREPPEPSGAVPVLARNRGLIEQSRESRAAIVELRAARATASTGF